MLRVFSLFAVVAAVAAADVTSATSVQPAVDLITRNFGKAAAAIFKLALKPEGNCPGGAKAPCFDIEQTDRTVSITGTTMSELTYGIGHYTRYTCGLTVGRDKWGGSHTNSPKWPCTSHFASVSVPRAVPVTWQDNVCTHSYSYVWYGEKEWTQHIDEMALKGINMFYAITGQEEIQYKAFLKFGLKDLEIREFFNGPAYLTWSRGQSMQTVGSAASVTSVGATPGLPRSWMQSQHALQIKILAQTRALGIIGVLPAFQGNMPPQIKRLYPNANISTTDDPAKHSDAGNCAWVASTDPLFGNVADAWMEIMIEDFGTDHWYQCDGFFTGMAPPWYDASDPASAVTGAAAAAASASYAEGASSPLEPLSAPVQPDPNWSPVWKGAWGGMSRTDPKAKWLYQGWAIRGWSDAAGASRLKALYDAVPKGQWVPLDMDVSGIWRYWGNYSFFGAPFIWTTLHDFGGNDGLKGDFRLLAGIPGDALDAGASIIGTGTTMEGINQNPVYYEYTYDTAWHREAQPLVPWFKSYAARRYGAVGGAGIGGAGVAAAAIGDAEEAWEILRTNVYNYAGCGSFGGYHDGSGVEWKPFGAPPVCTLPDPKNVSKAWELLVKVGATIDPVTYATLNYDIVNTGREVLAQLITLFEATLTTAAANHDKKTAMDTGNVLLAAYADLDALVGCDSNFLIGPWIAEAKKWANNSDAPEQFYEWQARSQVSTWWPVAPSDVDEWTANFTKAPPLDGYANKHWNGLIRDFYAKRVQCYVDQVSIDLPGSPMNKANMTRCALQAEMAFTQGTKTTYAEAPTSSKTLSLSAILLKKYETYF